MEEHTHEEEAPVLPEESGLVVLLGGGEVGTFLGGRGGSAAMTSGWLSKHFQMPPSGQTLCPHCTSSENQDYTMPKAPCICKILLIGCKEKVGGLGHGMSNSQRMTTLHSLWPDQFALNDTIQSESRCPRLSSEK